MWSVLQLLLVSYVVHLSKGDDVFDVTTVYNISQHCAAQCHPYEFQCRDGRCVLETKKCNVFPDCQDMSDEEGCDIPYTLPMLTTRRSCHEEYKGRIHSRTNAMGLPLYDDKSTVKESVGSKNVNITIDMNYPNISWEIKNWEAIHVQGLTRIEKGIANYFDHHLELALQSARYYIYFTNGPSDVKNEKIPFIFTYGYINYNYWYFYENCSVDNKQCTVFTIQNRDKTSIKVCCTSERFILQASYNQYIKINIENNKIQFYLGQDNPILYFNYDWTDSNNELSDIKYFSVAGDYRESYNPSLGYSVLSAEKENAELISPLVFVEDNRQLCLALVISTSSTNRNLPGHTTTTPRPGLFNSPFGPFLQILAEDLHKTEHHLYYLNNTNYKEGWKVHHVNITIDKAVVSPFKLKIRKVGPSDVKITRIASCDTEGDEVQILNQNTAQANNDATPAIYTVRSNVLARATKTNGEAELCLNGGVSTTGGCACPPGFTGADCGNGCGRNRFGQDCGGLCSFRLQECERYLLCTSYTGCSCAPGYKGDTCDTRCSPGQYGNSCKQKCGHCAHGAPCDIYTGACVVCEPGYHPPHCKKPYVYYGADPGLSSPDYGVITVSFDPSNYITAYGSPVLYQIQFRTKFGSWQIYANKIIPENNIYQRNGSIWDSLSESGSPRSNDVMETIEGLSPGSVYEVRVLFMDANFNKYDGELVGTSEILTKCDIPEEYNYKVNLERDTSSINLSWTYVNETVNWCPVTSYEVSWKENWQWLKAVVEQETFSLSGFLPGLAIRFKVRARTTGGFAPYSKTVLAATRHNGTSEVMRLRLVNSQSTAIQVAWDAPQTGEVNRLQYTVNYKCVEQPACSPGCVNATEGALTQSETSLTLSPLLPFARYQITVTPQDGQPATIHAGTAKAAPTEVPALSAQSPLRSNTSLTVFWDPVPVCSSFLQGYNYQLAQEADSLKLLASGFTRNTSISFNNLTASTDYVVKVFIVTIAGWNPESFLDIHTSTSATVPEAVRNLTVYKRGRGMLGLRWAAPRATYGTLKSFTVTHSLGQESVSHTVEPTPCVAWPDLYCLTVEGLRSNRKYNLTLRARNTDVAEDGEASSASGVTKESLPSVPEQLRLVSSGKSSVEVEWHTPSLANGIIRSFLISVEETERFDQDSCCQVYPLVETPVKVEALTYEAALTSLQPASTYYVSVSAKTVGMGPSQSLVVQTRPPNLPLGSEDLPRLIFDDDVSTGGKEGDWLHEEAKNQVNDTETDLYLPLVQAHLLLLVSTDPLTEPTGVLISQLDSVLRGYITKQFYFYSEYNQGEDVTLSRNAREFEQESQWGQCLLSTVEGVYQPVAVRVTEYNGVFNTDILYYTQIQFGTV